MHHDLAIFSRHIYSQLVDFLDRPGAGDMALSWRLYMLYLFLSCLPYFPIVDIFFRKTFHSIYGNRFPKCQCQGSAWIHDEHDDEAEKRLATRKTMKLSLLSNYIYLCSNWNFLDWHLLFHYTDILLALKLINLYLYLGFTIQDYQTLL